MTKEDRYVILFTFSMGFGKQNSMWCQLALVLRDRGDEKKMPIPIFFLGWDFSRNFPGGRRGLPQRREKVPIFLADTGYMFYL